MRRKFFGLALSTLLLALCFPAQAQQPKKVPRIGYVGGVSLSANTARHDAFRQGLGELHYVEGKNIIIDWRSAEGKLERLPVLAAEMVRLKLDVIVTSGPPQPVPPRNATNTIPIVMTNIAILLAMVSSPASRGLVETSRDCPPFPGN